MREGSDEAAAEFSDHSFQGNYLVQLGSSKLD